MGLSTKVRAVLEMADHRGFTKEEYNEVLAELLNKLDPTKLMGTKLCDAMMRLKPTVAFEAVAMRDSATMARREVYLSRRAPDDTAYPGQWHVPGSLYRHGERERDVADRLKHEFGVLIKHFRFVSRFIGDEQRGTVHFMVFMVDLDGHPPIDAEHGWFPINNRPVNMMVSHHVDPVIPLAALAYDRLRG